MNYANVIIKPLITEKTVNAASRGFYTFLINAHANKSDVMTAMKTILNVNPLQVRILRYRDHKRRINFYNPKKGSVLRKTHNIKKAIVKLSGDEKLDYFNIE